MKKWLLLTLLLSVVGAIGQDGHTFKGQVIMPDLTGSGSVIGIDGSGVLSKTSGGGSSFPLTGNVSGGGNTITNLSQMGTETWIDVKRDFGAVGDGVTDDTAAIQAAINYGVKTNNGYTVTLYFRSGIYIVSGALQETAAGRANAQLIIPDSTNTTAGSDASVRFLGPAYKANYAGSSSQGMGTNGATWRSTLTNEGASVFRCAGPTNTFNGRNICFENMGIQVPQQSSATALNLREFGWSRLKNVTVTVPTTPGVAMLQPGTNSVGVNMPKDGFAQSWYEDVEVFGYCVGINMTEHLDADNIHLCKNTIGFQTLGGSFVINIDRLYTTGSKYGIIGLGQSRLNINQWSIERAGGGAGIDWQTNEVDFIDSNNTWGRIGFRSVDLVTATRTGRIKRSGGENMVFNSIDFPQLSLDFNTSSSSAFLRGIGNERIVNSSSDGGFNALHARGSSEARTILSTGDGAGWFAHWGFDGSTYQMVAATEAIAKTPIVAGGVSGVLNFTTGTNLASQTTKMSIGPTGGGITNSLPTVFLAEVKAPTNVANFNLATNFLAINTKYTNNATLIGQRRSILWVDLTLTPSATDAAQVSIFVDQDADGTYEENYNTIKDGALTGAPASIRHFMDTLQPGAFFVLTNQSSGTATATVLSSKLTGF